MEDANGSNLTHRGRRLGGHWRARGGYASLAFVPVFLGSPLAAHVAFLLIRANSKIGPSVRAALGRASESLR